MLPEGVVAMTFYIHCMNKNPTSMFLALAAFQTLLAKQRVSFFKYDMHVLKSFIGILLFNSNPFWFLLTQIKRVMRIVKGSKASYYMLWFLNHFNTIPKLAIKQMLFYIFDTL